MVTVTHTHTHTQLTCLVLEQYTNCEIHLKEGYHRKIIFILHWIDAYSYFLYL